MLDEMDEHVMFNIWLGSKFKLYEHGSPNMEPQWIYGPVNHTTSLLWASTDCEHFSWNVFVFEKAEMRGFYSDIKPICFE